MDHVNSAFILSAIIDNLTATIVLIITQKALTTIKIEFGLPD